MQKRIAIAIVAVIVVLMAVAIVMVPKVLAILNSTVIIPSSGTIQ